ncbi:MAG: hypothetical protein DMG86_05120 [Acidobacteria bacterium]|nr:MAG: hypothetical protein DMG86_05120 [Acidobacteriota bacterium]PYX07089.1 MAG: hypothetical protein DMG85_12225 [Acidobacteriota bacterium]
MNRRLIWIEDRRFQGWGCSECGWRFTASDALTGKSLVEMIRNFELQREKEFTSHVCADHPKSKNKRRS